MKGEGESQSVSQLFGKSVRHTHTHTHTKQKDACTDGWIDREKEK